MEYKEIVSVTGESGLFQLLSSKSDGAIVRSLDGNTTRFVPSRNHNFTPLESIEVFTTGENVPLSDVFKTMQEKEPTIPVIEAGRNTDEIKQYFGQVYPELDKGRVYMSDMKKMLKWYPILKENDLLKFREEAEGSQEEEIESENTQEEKGKATEEKKETKNTAKGKDKPGAKTAKKDPEDTPAEKKPVKKSEKPAPAKKKAAAKKADSGKS